MLKPYTEMSVLAGLELGAWTSSESTGGSTDSRTYTRPLDVCESKFEAAGRGDGMSDILLQFDLEIPGPEARDAFFARIIPAWAALRARHPLLASTVISQDGQHHALPGGRAFQFTAPASVEEAIARARETVLVAELDTMKSVLVEKGLNGPRVLLDPDSCLARIIIYQDDARRPGSMGFLLAIAHAISDGLSIFTLTNELFALIASPSLPTPASTPTFLNLRDFLTGSTSLPSPWDISSDPFIAEWGTVPSPGDLTSILPPSSERVYLEQLPGAQADSSALNVSPKSTLARQRWFWAISRALLVSHNARTPRTLAFPRIAREGPPVQPNTEWIPLKFSQSHTKSILEFCKHNKISPSMLSYSLLSIAISNLIAQIYPKSPYQPILIGFPMSLRRFLSHPTSLSDLAIRITFGSIHLPRSPQAPTPENLRALRFTALTGARLATRQFAHKVDAAPLSRNRFLSTAYFLIMDRLLTSHSLNLAPLDEARGAMNASMIGDVDRVLPTIFVLPTANAEQAPVEAKSPPPGLLRLSNVFLGTRLHRGEGMLMEAFTWSGQLTFCLGFDDFCIEPDLVRRILGELEKLGTVLAEGWRQ